MNEDTLLPMEYTLSTYELSTGFIILNGSAKVGIKKKRKY